MKYRKEVFRSLTLITQLGISVMVPLFLCIFVGVTIDKYFGTSTTVWFMLIGMLAGGRNAYILAKSVLHQNVEESKKRKRP
ncbi:MAG: AtpZ/AtpI family protein [Clostridiales bacterium]|nr:AtpZ/AtpI family protein [Clostridiales bacterium]